MQCDIAFSVHVKLSSCEFVAGKEKTVNSLSGSHTRSFPTYAFAVTIQEQFCFLHDAMLESVTCGDTQITAADLRMKIAKYTKVDPSTGQNTFQSQFNVSTHC